jgi:hypothetical protein
MDKTEIIDKLRQARELAEKLKDAGIKTDLCDQIIEEVDELLEILSRKEENELVAYRLMIVLFEKLSGLGDKVPLLDVFLELYVTALKSSLFFIDEVLKKHGWIHETCMKYCRIRHKHETDARALGETDEVEIARDGHDVAMNAVGFFQYQKYQDKFREQYESYVHQLALEDLLRQAKEAKERNAEPQDGGSGSPPDPTPVPAPPKPKPLTLDEFLIWMLGSLRERMTPEEWEKFSEHLREMFPPLPPR